MSAPTSASPRPAVGAGVVERFAGSGNDIIYQPCLLRAATVHFSSTKAGIEDSRQIRLANPILASGIDWENTREAPQEIADSPVSGASFGELPGFAMNSANYKQVEKDFSEWLYRNERLDVFYCPALKEWSKPGENEGDFRVRLTHAAHEARDAEVEKVRDSAAKKIATLETRLRTAEARVAKEKAEAGAAKMTAGVSILGGLLGGLFGRKVNMTTLSRGSTAINRTTSAYKQQQDVAQANARVEDIAEDIQTLQSELEAEIAKISASYDSTNLKLETESIKPRRTDVKVEEVALLWMPAGTS
jgi:hypothetical protein